MRRTASALGALATICAAAFAGIGAGPYPSNHTPQPTLGWLLKPTATSDPALESLIQYRYRHEQFKGRTQKVLHAWKLPTLLVRQLIPSFRDDVGSEPYVILGLIEGKFIDTGTNIHEHPQKWAYVVLVPSNQKIVHVKMMQTQPTPGYPFPIPPVQPLR